MKRQEPPSQIPLSRPRPHPRPPRRPRARPAPPAPCPCRPPTAARAPPAAPRDATSTAPAPRPWRADRAACSPDRNSSRKMTRSPKPGARRKPMRLASRSSTSPTARLLRASVAPEAVAHHDPVDRAAIAHGAALLRLPHHLAVEAGPRDAQRLRVHLRQQIEIDEAVVHRRDQRIRKRVSKTREMRVAARRVDHDHVVGAGELAERLRETLPLIDIAGLAARCRDLDRAHIRHRQLDALRRGKRPPVLDIARERRLPRIDIDAPHLAPGLEQADDKMQRRGRLPRPALLIAQAQ